MGRRWSAGGALGSRKRHSSATDGWMVGVRGAVVRTARWGTMVLTWEEEEEGGIFNRDKEQGREGFEEEDNEFLFVQCAGKAEWVVLRVRLCWAGRWGVGGWA